MPDVRTFLQCQNHVTPRLAVFIVSTVLLWALMFSPPPYAAAEDISYTDSTGSLQSSPSWFHEFTSTAAFYSTMDSSGNTVTIDYTTKADPQYVFGGTADTLDVSGNIVALHNGITWVFT